MNAELKDLSFKLWIAKHCGQGRGREREAKIANARHALRIALKRPLLEFNHAAQRDLINRRQRRASREGIELYWPQHVGEITAYIRKWGAA